MELRERALDDTGRGVLGCLVARRFFQNRWGRWLIRAERRRRGIVDFCQRFPAFAQNSLRCRCGGRLGRSVRERRPDFRQILAQLNGVSCVSFLATDRGSKYDRRGWILEAVGIGCNRRLLFEGFLSCLGGGELPCGLAFGFFQAGVRFLENSFLGVAPRMRPGRNRLRNRFPLPKARGKEIGARGKGVQSRSGECRFWWIAAGVLARSMGFEEHVDLFAGANFEFWRQGHKDGQAEVGTCPHCGE